MKPLAKISYPIHELISKRWSPRAFSDRPLDDQQLRSLFEAARWAPSSYNEQPWRFIYATRSDPVAFDKIAASLSPGNQPWASRAPVLVIVVARTTFSGNERPNRHALYDVGAAVAMLSLQATALGLHIHQMAGFNEKQVLQAYQIKAPFEPVLILAIGYMGDAASLPLELREREISARTRHEQSQFVFNGLWRG